MKDDWFTKDRTDPHTSQDNLKWYYDQKKKIVFPLDFKTMLTKH